MGLRVQDVGLRFPSRRSGFRSTIPVNESIASASEPAGRALYVIGTI